MPATTVIISVTNVIGDLRLKSHLEVANIEPADLRYKIQAGTEKDEEIYQSLQDSHNALTHICRKFLSGVTLSGGGNFSDDDSLDSTVTEITYSFDLTERRSQVIKEPLSKAMHAYLVDSVLMKFYNSVNQEALAAVHERRCAQKQAEIEDLLYTKLKPIYN